MLGHGRSRTKLVTVLGAAVLAASFGCRGESPVTVDGILLFQAKGGGRGPSVDQAIPNWGEQAQGLKVHVLGSGYDQGSVATFTLDGAPAKITTDSTRFVSTSELVAIIKVDSEADLALHDVEVMTMRGKKGIGADLFQVVEEGAGEPPGQIDPIPLSVTFLPPMVSSLNPRSEPGSANRAEILLSGNFQVHWSGYGWVELDLSQADWLDPDPVKVPEWYDPNGDGCDDGDCVGQLDGYISTGFPFYLNGASVEGGFRALQQPGDIMVTAMHRVWTANKTNWVLHFHRPVSNDVCSHDGLSVEHMTVRVDAVDTDGDLDVDEWTLRPRDVGDSPAILCGFAAKGKPFNAIVGQFQVPFGFDLTRLP